MTRSLPLTFLAAASLFCGTAALAQSTVAKPAPKQAAAKMTAKTVATSKTMTVTKPAVGKPMATAKTTTRTTAAAKGRLVTTKTSTGKTVTYDCGKSGNATKAACKK